MSFKIVQCIFPVVHQNKYTLLQYFNSSTTHEAKKSFSSKLYGNGDLLPTKTGPAHFMLRSFAQDPYVCIKSKKDCGAKEKQKDDCNMKEKKKDECGRKEQKKDDCNKKKKKETGDCIKRDKKNDCKRNEEKKNECSGSENLAAVLYGQRDLRMEIRPMPKIKPNQVLLQMEVCGVCGTDIHFYKDGKLGDWTVNKPIIIGHEASGTVVECGKNVKKLQRGDKVAVEPQIPCRVCSYCKAGNYHMCPQLYFCAAPPFDGNLCRFFAHDEDFCHKLPDHLDHEIGTLMEPLAVGVHGCKKGVVTSGDIVLVIGGGPVGLCSLLSARAFGASKIILLDINEFKLKRAMEMGADCAMNINRVPEEEVVKKIIEIAGGRPNKTLECCGHEQGIRVGFLATRTNGKLVLLGLGKDNQRLPIMDAVYREVDVIGAIRYANDYPIAIDMVANCKVDPKPIITHHFKLEDSCAAYETAANGEENFIKIFVHANPKWQPLKAKC